MPPIMVTIDGIDECIDCASPSLQAQSAAPFYPYNSTEYFFNSPIFLFERKVTILLEAYIMQSRLALSKLAQ